MLLPLPLQLHLVMLCAWWDIHCNCDTPLWSMSNCIALLRFLWINIVLCFCYMQSCLLLCLMTSVVTYVLASLAHLYIPQLFTHCLSTIVMYMI